MSISKPIHGQKSAQIKPYPGIVTRRTYRTLVCHGKVTKMFRDKKTCPDGFWRAAFNPVPPSFNTLKIKNSATTPRIFPFMFRDKRVQLSAKISAPQRLARWLNFWGAG